MAITLHATTSLTTATNFIRWTGIPQTGKDLLVTLNWDGTANGSYELDLEMNYLTNTIRRIHSSATTILSQTADSISVMDSDYPTTNTFHSLAVYVTNYTAATAHNFSVDAVVEANSAVQFGNHTQIVAGRTASTAAVDNFTFIAGFGDFAVNTTASIYIVS